MNYESGIKNADYLIRVLKLKVSSIVPSASEGCGAKMRAFNLSMRLHRGHYGANKVYSPPDKGGLGGLLNKNTDP